MSVTNFIVSFSQGSLSAKNGYLLLSSEINWMWLKDSHKNTIRKGKVGPNFAERLKCGATIRVAEYTINILKKVGERECAPPKQKIDATNESISQENFNTREETIVSSPSSEGIAFLDPVLMRSMRPYQIEAGNFILRRLQDVNGTSRADSDIPLTGAILADDMGTGKTLVGLSVMWALCRHGRGKGIIVCPSSLISNWRNEIKKWLPATLGRTSLYAVGGKSSSSLNEPRKIVRQFATSHSSVHPLLVTSYEMFRLFAEDLNAIPSLSTVVCDEGHRLKNADGTLTTLALGNCIAMQRLVLTGTPIQNHLDELFAVVNFAAPGYLGTLKDFQTEFGDPITSGTMIGCSPLDLEKAEQCHLALQERLSPIFIRRSGHSLLKDVLPPRHIITLACDMTHSQKQKYEQVASTVCGGIFRAGRSSGCETDGSDEERNAPRGKRRRKGKSEKEAGDVLPVLQQLRMVCSSGSLAEDRGDATTTQSSPNFSSIKYQTLREIFLRLKSCRDAGKMEKIVIVSNYIATLNDVEAICRMCELPVLRIDGSVGAEKRQKLVDVFNSPQRSHIVMLISTKAGGVGLNLIGANRLVLLEPDWNPATDQQAFGRVWRLGQSKEVFIYRLICKGTIEESIVGRQIHKLSLTSVLEKPSAQSSHGEECKGNESAADNGPDKDSTDISSNSMDRLVGEVFDASVPIIRTPAGLRDLVFPTSNGEHATCSGLEESSLEALRDVFVKDIVKGNSILESSIRIYHCEE